ncbi:8078_t:CDS:2, partial [Gigaspora margarita]
KTRNQLETKIFLQDINIEIPFDQLPEIDEEFPVMDLKLEKLSSYQIQILVKYKKKLQAIKTNTSAHIRLPEKICTPDVDNLTYDVPFANGIIDLRSSQYHSSATTTNYQSLDNEAVEVNRTSINPVKAIKFRRYKLQMVNANANYSVMRFTFSIVHRSEKEVVYTSHFQFMSQDLSKSTLLSAFRYEIQARGPFDVCERHKTALLNPDSLDGCWDELYMIAGPSISEAYADFIANRDKVQNENPEPVQVHYSPSEILTHDRWVKREIDRKQVAVNITNILLQDIKRNVLHRVSGGSRECVCRYYFTHYGDVVTRNEVQE